MNQNKNKILGTTLLFFCTLYVWNNTATNSIAESTVSDSIGSLVKEQIKETSEQ